jgi:hypothetical protein
VKRFSPGTGTSDFSGVASPVSRKPPSLLIDGKPRSKVKLWNAATEPLFRGWTNRTVLREYMVTRILGRQNSMRMSQLFGSFLSLNPTNAVGGFFISSLQRAAQWLPNPTNAVGGLFIYGLYGLQETKSRLGLNDPPTALVGFRGWAACSCRLGLNNPPTALVGFAAPKRPNPSAAKGARLSSGSQAINIQLRRSWKPVATVAGLSNRTSRRSEAEPRSCFRETDEMER